MSAPFPSRSDARRPLPSRLDWRQADSDLSIPDQRRQAQAYCKSRGWELVTDS